MDKVSYTEFLEYCVSEGISDSIDNIQEAYEEYLNDSTNNYADLLEFFVENGIFLDENQLAALQEFKSDEKAYYAQRRALEKYTHSAGHDAGLLDGKNANRRKYSGLKKIIDSNRDKGYNYTARSNGVNYIADDGADRFGYGRTVTRRNNRSDMFWGADSDSKEHRDENANWAKFEAENNFQNERARGSDPFKRINKERIPGHSNSNDRKRARHNH